MKIALLQVNVPAVPADVREMLSRMEPGSPEGPLCLACLPELFHTNYSSLPVVDAGLESSLMPALSECLRERPDLVLAGSLALERQGRRFNTLTIFHGNGVTPLYDKLHLFRPMKEDDFFVRGDHLGVLEVHDRGKIWRVGFAICYDLRFPEVFRLLAAAGCDLVVVVAQWPSVRINIWRALLQARAAENQLYLAGVNRCGDDNGEEFGGSSMILAPDGSILAEAEAQPRLLQAVLSKDEIGRSRRLFYSFLDRPAAAYQVTGNLPVNSLTIRHPHMSK